ncbi:MAG: amidohydrolase family protein [Lachnospiraceae bacterium]|nr:amidohydrolase family protein [Lachnospiraceae bacterium]
MHESYVIKGAFCYSRSKDELDVVSDGYLVCEDGISKGVFEELPEAYASYPLEDYTGCLITPGLTDLHVHAPQYAFRGMGMDLELLEWLNTNTFPEEAKYADLEYAKKAYAYFTEDLRKGATTRAVVFATLHVPATELLMDMLEEAGIASYVGKVNMDRNSPDYLCETTEDSAAETLRWILDTKDRYRFVKPIITPRFTPSCTDELMKKLKDIQMEYHLPVQSHLSENLGEIDWVQELCPNTSFYGQAYDQFGMFGGDGCPTIMAHCVHSSVEEIALMKKNGVYVVHCPECNMNLTSGVAPVRTYLDEGVHIGLGSDVAGGTVESVLVCMANAIRASKVRYRLLDDTLPALTLEEAFYMGTLGGGSFFGRVGSFEAGYEMDAVVFDDSSLHTTRELTTKERLERIIYLSDDRNIVGKFVKGQKLF